MSSAASALAITTGVVELIQEVAGLTLSRGSLNDRWLEDGEARWISCQSEGWVISACYHKTKWHSASVETGKFWPLHKKARSEAPPGEWAVTWVSSGGWDKTFYDYW